MSSPTLCLERLARVFLSNQAGHAFAYKIRGVTRSSTVAVLDNGLQLFNFMVFDGQLLLEHYDLGLQTLFLVVFLARRGVIEVGRGCTGLHHGFEVAEFLEFSLFFFDFTRQNAEPVMWFAVVTVSTDTAIALEEFG